MSWSLSNRRSRALDGDGQRTAPKSIELSIWQRFKEAPKLYPEVAKQLRDTATPLLHRGSERDAGGNTKAEQQLRADLEALANAAHATALAKISALEAEHGKRRDWVWAELGESPLAGALAPLAKLATAAATTLGWCHRRRSGHRLRERGLALRPRRARSARLGEAAR